MNAGNPETTFLSSPKIVEHYTLLSDIGIFQYIDTLNMELRNYQNLIEGVLDIFNHTGIDDILESAVSQISDRTMPSFIAFLWKPFQNKEELIIKGYKNYKLVNMHFLVKSIAPFEIFFQQYPRPIHYNDLVSRMGESAGALGSERPELIIPILGPSGLYGLILVGQKILGGEFSVTEFTFIQQLMAFVSLAIQNHLHYDHSLRDVKTGLYNHGFFITRLSEEIARVKRYDYTASVIVIDVDFFKLFNDTYGHVAGDHVLESIATLIKHGVRSEDVPSRFGGEEFTVLLPNSTQEATLGVAERLRASVANLKVPWEVPLPQVTISLGTFTFNKNMNLSPNEIVDRADKALYESKKTGRNRTTAAKE
jgi:diguanylate cyclase (GGDEF)-like protein